VLKKLLGEKRKKTQGEIAEAATAP
jgi:hypothetical protein